MNKLWMSALTVMILAVTTACIYPPGLRSKTNLEIDVEEIKGEGELDRDRWHYIEMEETVCANGSTAGMGLNFGESRREIVVYLNGGGACWDASSCNLFRTAANLDVTYGAGRMGEELYPLVKSGLLDRDSEVNPWPQASFAYIPYCTGDLHSGRATTDYDSFGGGKPIHHRGAENLEHFLERLTEVFPEAEKIWLVGISAGGYGITWNFPLFRQAFGEAEIHVFSDASPWLPVEQHLWAEWKRNWQMEMPKGCVMCDVAPDHLLRYLLEAYPESRFGVSVFERDSTLAAFMRVMPVEIEKNIEWFLDERFYGDNTSAFIAHGNEHEALLFLDSGLISKDGQLLSEFLKRWADGY